MRSAPLAVALLFALAMPAEAFPTALVNVPTGGVAPFKGYHFGTYHYVQPNLVSTPASPYLFMGSFLAGVSPYFELAPGISAGAVEVGLDFLYPFPSSLYPAAGTPGPDNGPLPLQPHLKLGLLQETATLPSLAIGAYEFSLPFLDYSANLLHASLTKSLSWGDQDLGQFTAALFHGNPVALGVDANGWMAGYYRNLPAGAYAMVDYTSGHSALGGANLAVGYCINPNLSVSVGYFVANERNQGTAIADKAFVFLDWVGDLPI